MKLSVTVEEIKKTLNLIRPFVHSTPVLTSSILNQISGAELFFKCENFQKAGSFKIRGATSAIMQLSGEEKANGVLTHSSGNFAQALALAAKQNNTPAYIVMPGNAPQVKVAAVNGYGAKIRFCENTRQMREQTMLEWQRETGATFLHPYDNLHVIRGQASCAFELIDQVEGLDAIVSPVGGGGLVSGTALAAHYFSPGTQVFAAEPSGADDAWHSFRTGEIFHCENPNTIADGLLTSLGKYTFPIIRELVTEIYRVTDEEIKKAMKLVWTRMKIIIEPSSATVLAVVLKHKDVFAGQRVGMIISGGNVDIDKLPF